MNNRIKLLISIVNKSSEKSLKKFYQKYRIPFEFVVSGSGTASSSVLEYFGLQEEKKSIFLNIIPEPLENDIIEKLETDYNLKEPGKGISFTIPIGSSSKYVSEETYKHTKKGAISDMKKEEMYLIVTIVSEGYSDNVMNIAKKAGAGGGTLINGRTIGENEKTAFMGITIEPEKDIVLTLVKNEIKNTVMNDIITELGITTKAKGMCFSIPVDQVAGLNKS